jgi:hypothetical protein
MSPCCSSRRIEELIIDSKAVAQIQVQNGFPSPNRTGEGSRTTQVLDQLMRISNPNRCIATKRKPRRISTHGLTSIELPIQSIVSLKIICQTSQNRAVLSIMKECDVGVGLVSFGVSPPSQASAAAETHHIRHQLDSCLTPSRLCRNKTSKPSQLCYQTIVSNKEKARTAKWQQQRQQHEHSSPPLTSPLWAPHQTLPSLAIKVCPCYTWLS